MFFCVGGAVTDEAYFYRSNEYEKFSALTNLENAVYSVDWANNDLRVALGCGDGGIRLAKIGLPEDAEQEID